MLLLEKPPESPLNECCECMLKGFCWLWCWTLVRDTVSQMISQHVPRSKKLSGEGYTCTCEYQFASPTHLDCTFWNLLIMVFSFQLRFRFNFGFVFVSVSLTKQTQRLSCCCPVKQARELFQCLQFLDVLVPCSQQQDQPAMKSPAIDMFDLIEFDSINQWSINQCSINQFDLVSIRWCPVLKHSCLQDLHCRIR